MISGVRGALRQLQLTEPSTRLAVRAGLFYYDILLEISFFKSK